LVVQVCVNFSGRWGGAIVGAPFPRLRGFQNLISGIPLLLVVFAPVFYLTGLAQPGSFSEPLDKIGALYFTVTVFSTVRFGGHHRDDRPGPAPW
jgi:hypothetical protein